MSYRAALLHCFTCHTEAELVYLNGGYWTIPEPWVVMDAVLDGGNPAVFCSERCVREGAVVLGKSAEDITPVERPPARR